MKPMHTFFVSLEVRHSVAFSETGDMSGHIPKHVRIMALTTTLSPGDEDSYLSQPPRNGMVYVPMVVTAT